jgi:amidase
MDIHFESLLDISDRVRQRVLRSEDVTEALLERIAKYEGRLNSVAMLLADAALEQARRADAEVAAGFWRGPLHGVPIGVKDLLWTKGLPTLGGMELLSDFRPACDATVVERLKRAGAVLIAKLHMTEGATLNHHPSLPRPVNPWSALHWTGVSSSGSGVATAAGFCYGAIGSDTGGSIRMPSSANNLTGIKPTWGRVSRHGLIHLSESLDHLGPMARSTGDAAAILQAIAGGDPKDDTSLTDPVPDYLGLMSEGVSGLTLGIDWAFATEDVPEEIVAALKHALEALHDLGMHIREISVPWTAKDASDGRALFDAEVLAAHAEYFPAKADRYGPWLRETLKRSAQTKPLEIARSYQARDRYKGRLRALFRDVDLVLTPGLGKLLPKWETMEAMGRGEIPFDFDLLRFTSPFNVAGVPTISLPGGFTADGLPIGIQLAGPWLAEPVLIRAGAAFQRVTDFHTRHPDLEAVS